MRINVKKLEEYTKEELNIEYYNIISNLNKNWINLDLVKMNWKDREKKSKEFNYDLQKLNKICILLWIANQYVWLLNDSNWWFD